MRERETLSNFQRTHFLPLLQMQNAHVPSDKNFAHAERGKRRYNDTARKMEKEKKGKMFERRSTVKEIRPALFLSVNRKSKDTEGGEESTTSLHPFSKGLWLLFQTREVLLVTGRAVKSEKLPSKVKNLARFRSVATDISKMRLLTWVKGDHPWREHRRPRVYLSNSCARIPGGRFARKNLIGVSGSHN